MEDFNQEWAEDGVGMNKLQEECDLHCIHARDDEELPPTYARGTKKIDHMWVSRELLEMAGMQGSQADYFWEERMMFAMFTADG